MRVRPSLLGLHHLALNVRDLPVMKRFYVEVLGFRVEWEPDAENVHLTSGSDNLAIPSTIGCKSSIIRQSAIGPIEPLRGG
jgi:catechol 2,3-dioxygenase-like lactoylglutathione lyase family enzyme